MAGNLRCGFCNEGEGVRDASLGVLMGPVGHTSEGDPIHVHRQCALWSPEVHQNCMSPVAYSSVPTDPLHTRSCAASSDFTTISVYTISEFVVDLASDLDHHPITRRSLQALLLVCGSTGYRLSYQKCC